MPKAKEISLLLILILFASVLIGLEFYSLSQNSHYKWDFFPLIGLLFLMYYLRNKIDLHPVHYFLFGIFLVVHNAGVFDMYNTFPLGIEYDTWAHLYFGLVSSLMLFRFMTFHNQYQGTSKVVLVLLILLGFSAVHEIIEYFGAITVGKGEGVFFIGAGDSDPFDTQKDLLNNLIGACLGFLSYILKKRFA